MRKSIIICLILCIIAPLSSEAKKQAFGNGVYWELSDGVLTISGTGSMPDFPSYDHKRPWGKKKIWKIVVEEGVTHIGNRSFNSHYYQYGIQSITISQSVKSIGSSAFLECQLTSVVMPSITTIGEFAFACCERLTSIKFSNDLTTICSNAFADCVNITSVDFPNSLKSIGSCAFDCCDRLTSVIIPGSVMSIGSNAFAGCNNLKSISVPNSVMEIGEHAFSERYNHNFVSGNYRGIILCLPKWFVEKDEKEWEKCGLSKSSVEQYKNGVIDKNGMLLYAAGYGRTITKYNSAGNGTDYYAIKENGKCGLMNSNGSWVIPQTHDYSEIMLINGFIRVKSHNFYGIFTLDGKEIIRTSRGYTSIDYDSSKGTFAVAKPRYTGVCDAQGNEISLTKLPPTADDIKADGGYASAVELMNGSTKYYMVSKGGKYGLTNAEGKVIVPTEMEALESAGTGYLRYKLNGFWGVMNYAGKIIIDTDRGYTSIGDFKTFNKRFSYTMTGYKGECDATGRQISKIKVETPKQNTSVASSSGSSSSSSSSSNSNSGNNTTTIHVEHHRDPVPVQEWHACVGCGGMGTMGCDNCGGSGTKYYGDRLRRCGRCNGQGLIPCNVCYGNKGQYVTVYK